MQKKEQESNFPDLDSPDQCSVLGGAHAPVRGQLSGPPRRLAGSRIALAETSSTEVRKSDANASADGVSSPRCAKTDAVACIGATTGPRTAEGFQTNARHCDGPSLLGSLIATSTEKSWNWLKLCNRT
jgi:hypothetical protein